MLGLHMVGVTVAVPLDSAIRVFQFALLATAGNAQPLLDMRRDRRPACIPSIFSSPCSADEFPVPTVDQLTRGSSAIRLSFRSRLYTRNSQYNSDYVIIYRNRQLHYPNSSASTSKAPVCDTRTIERRRIRESLDGTEQNHGFKVPQDE
ncbi:hypothetical protein BCR44DRAFT_35904 [Catenaria anguillulae PL171]|uniref:Uncharacterized protein n=1 Tax=Catenaria anguillulae PL171 TaxID=765915 RepID=A0A1Y2HJ44_9FUNG|nr:hypothetical protein BCR44DRAFT_35904 [Catenaria anguillulae PL171]